MEDWNELRLVLTVQRCGNLTTAAHVLGIDHSTAFRRLKAVEARLGTQLFERMPGGAYETTEAGARMATGAEKMEAEALALDRDLTGRDHRPCGLLRVTSTESLAYGPLTSHLASFRQLQPCIVIELAVDNRELSLSRREADIALRSVRPKQGDLWGRKLAGVAWALYGAPRYLEAGNGPPPRPGDADKPIDLGDHLMIGWEEFAGRGVRAAEWLAQAAPAKAFVYRTNSLVGQLAAAKAGIGIALLPCYLGDTEPGLVRLYSAPVAEIADELWIVTHAELKNATRVRAFFDLVGQALAREHSLFEGDCMRLPPRALLIA
jgi:DNA-binding transcriptional LysR family regulator